MSRPATWPATGIDPYIEPHLAASALLIIDTQVDFVDGGASPIAGTTQVLPAIAALRSAMLAAKRPIVHVIRLYDGNDVDAVRRTAIGRGDSVVAPHTAGAAVVPELRDSQTPEPSPDRLLAGEILLIGEGEYVTWKPRWSAFFRTKLDEHLRQLGVDTVIVAGCNFPNCPRATIFDASARDYRILMVADAISGVQSHHIDELGLIGALHTDTVQLTSTLSNSHGPH